MSQRFVLALAPLPPKDHVHYHGLKSIGNTRFPPAFDMRAFGRGLQFLGLLVLPIGMVLEIAGRVSLGQMLQLLIVGVCLFGIGRIAEGYAKD